MRSLLCVLAAGLAVSSLGADAATCIVSNATLAFGNYNPVSPTPTTANASITIQCADLISVSETVPYTLLLSAGSGTVINRKMLGGSISLPYNIYTSASYATIWDNTTGVGGSVALVGLLGLPVLTYGTNTQTAFGRILSSQPVPAGSYTDSLVITVSF